MPNHSLRFQLHGQSCMSVAPSPIRLAQVNDLQHLKTGNSLTSGDANRLAGATPFICCHLALPGVASWIHVRPFEKAQSKLVWCSAQGLWFIWPQVFMKCKTAQLYSTIHNAQALNLLPPVQMLGLGEHTQLLKMQALRGKSFLLKWGAASELWFKLVTVTWVLTDG